METIIDFIKTIDTLGDTFILPEEYVKARSELEEKYGKEFIFEVTKTIHANRKLIKE